MNLKFRGRKFSRPYSDPRNPRKFSPSKILGYTVCHYNLSKFSAKLRIWFYVQWNLWITDIAGPRWSVHNREVSFIKRVHPVMWQPFPVGVCHVFESCALLECREAFKRWTMGRNSLTLEEQQIFFIPVSRDCLLSEGNLYWFCPLGRDFAVHNS